MFQTSKPLLYTNIEQKLPNKFTWTNALQNRCYMCIQWTQDLYSVVITQQSNPPISQFNSLYNEFTVSGQCFHAIPCQCSFQTCLYIVYWCLCISLCVLTHVHLTSTLLKIIHMAVALNTTDFRKVYFFKSYKIFLLMCRTCNHF